MHLHAPASTYMHLQASASTSMHLHAPTHTYMHLYAPTCTYMHLQASASTSMHLHAPTCTCFCPLAPQCTYLHLVGATYTFLHTHQFICTLLKCPYLPLLVPESSCHLPVRPYSTPACLLRVPPASPCQVLEYLTEVDVEDAADVKSGHIISFVSSRVLGHVTNISLWRLGDKPKAPRSRWHFMGFVEPVKQSDGYHAL